MTSHGGSSSRSGSPGRPSSWNAHDGRSARRSRPRARRWRIAANLGGGTHHAFADGGRGFCVFNDVVVAVRALRREERFRRVLIVDLDVHQGDGTHAAFLEDAEAFTFSVNGFRNYPFRRVPGDLELDLPDGTGDEAYLDGLGRLLPQAVARARADLCFYLAGADPYGGDRLGALTDEGRPRRARRARAGHAGTGRRAGCASPSRAGTPTRSTTPWTSTSIPCAYSRRRRNRWLERHRRRDGAPPDGARLALCPPRQRPRAAGAGRPRARRRGRAVRRHRPVASRGCCGASANGTPPSTCSSPTRGSPAAGGSSRWRPSGSSR